MVELFWRNGVVMFRFAARILVSCVLIAATAFAGVVPAVGRCETSHRGCRAKQCSCGCCCTTPKPSAHSCCTPKTTAQTCRCSTAPERPATPEQRQTFSERYNARYVTTLPSMPVVFDDGPQVPTPNDSALLAPLPTLPQQAVLCRWLV